MAGARCALSSDGLLAFPLNRQAHHAKFPYVTSDHSSPERLHQLMLASHL
jgi:hypothetical protein